MCETTPGEERGWVREMRVEDESGGRRLRADEASRGLIGGPRRTAHKGYTRKAVDASHVMPARRLAECKRPGKGWWWWSLKWCPGGAILLLWRIERNFGCAYTVRLSPEFELLVDVPRCTDKSIQ